MSGWLNRLGLFLNNRVLNPVRAWLRGFLNVPDYPVLIAVEAEILRVAQRKINEIGGEVALLKSSARHLESRLSPTDELQNAVTKTTLALWDVSEQLAALRMFISDAQDQVARDYPGPLGDPDQQKDNTQ